MCLIRWLSGAFHFKPEELEEKASTAARDLINRALEDVEPGSLMDYHTHVAGTGAGGTGLSVNERMLSWQYPFHRIKFSFYMSACGVTDLSRSDQQLIERLTSLVRYFPARGKYYLLAFDRHYREDGTVNLEKTEFYVPNEYVFDLASRFPDFYVPVLSVHPYREDALQELEKWSKRGGRIIKWLPNAMGIHPSSPHCDAFYSKMKELGLILLSHGGEEKAVEAEEDQKLGNPLYLRPALDHGVKVIVAHCASLGTNEDLDDPHRPERSNFELFLRLMEDPKYEGLVFGDISAMTQFNRLGLPLTTILQRTDLQDRLVNGSDYPLPAINLLVRIRSLVKMGYLDPVLAPALKEIYHFNPLLFDYVLKRNIVAPGTNQKLAAKIFLANPALD